MNNAGMKLDDFSRYLPYPCYLEHDSKSAAFLELWNHPELDSAVIILLNRNLGGGIITNHHIHQGISMHSGTLEHMCINPDGPLCYCGSRGCLETYCSANALEQAAGMPAKEFFPLLREKKSPQIIQIWKDFLNHLAFAMKNLNLVIDAPIILSGYYLFLPLRFTDQFPFLAVSPTPLPSWGFTEAMPGGLFTTVPLAIAALAQPFLRRRMHRSGRANMWGMLTACLILGLLTIALDSRLGGLGWRYIADFGWLFALAALPAWLFALDCSRPRLRWLMRAGVLALLMFSITITVLSLFMPGREDELIRANSVLFLEVQSWFALP